jgi:hypothetical protein
VSGILGQCYYLVDLSPPCFDTGDVEQDGAVLPKRTLLDVVDEANGAEVHVVLPLPLDDVEFRYISWVGCVW